MALSAALILATAEGQSFAVDEIFYLGRTAEDSGRIVQYESLSSEYLLAPFDGHLQLGGKLIYEATFAVAGADYTAFVLVNVLALCACVALVFELARRRVGTLAALPPCVLLLFLGFAREVLLWPFDLHTLAAIAFGLGAFLALERDDRRGDALACALLVLSVTTIEVGLALLAGVAVLVLLRPDRLRRAWIFLLPAALYAAWWIWARKFGQDESAISIDNVDLIPKTVFHSAAAVLGALTGTNPVIPATYITAVTWFGKGLAVVAGVAVALRLAHRRVPAALWAWLAALLFYWVLMGAAARPPEGMRYVFFGAVGALLVAAAAFDRPPGRWVTLAVVVIAVLALPANLAQMRSGHESDALHEEAAISRTEFAMLELAAERVDPAYVASDDPNVSGIGGGLPFGISAGAYLRSVERNGSPAFTLADLRGQSEELRRIADVTLADAVRLRPKVVAEPASPAACRTVAPAPGAGTASVPLPPGRTVYGSAGARPVTIGLRRFADGESGVLEELPPGSWRSIEIPADAAPEPWRAVVRGAIAVCEQGTS